MKLFKLKIIQIITLFIVFFTLNIVSYSYWANNDLSTGLLDNSIPIGEWGNTSQAPNGIPEYNPQDIYATGDLVWFEGNIYEIRNGGYTSTPPDENVVYGPYNEITKEWRLTNTYQDNEVVYFNNNFYFITNSGQFNGSGLNGTLGYETLNSIEWDPNQPSYTTNDVVLFNNELYRATAGWTTGQPDQSGNWEKFNSFDWSPTRIYASAGTLVFYNGNYYTNNWYVQGTAPGNGGPWSLANIQTWGGKNFALNDYALHNGNLYQAIGRNNGQRRNQTPGTLGAFGIWKRVDTQEWQQFNQYVLNEYVLYQGDVYQVVNQTNATQTAPGTVFNAWNKVNTSEWQWFNFYQNGDYVFYNDVPFQVANAANANNNVAPGSISNAWNRIDSLYYQSFNLYQVNDIVIYENTAYIAIASSFSVIPGSPGSSSIWALYSN